MRSRVLAVLILLAVASCGGEPVVPVDATPDADLTDALDLTPPDTTITSAPPLLTNVATSRFEFTSSEPGTFKCRLDGGVLAPCTSPSMLAALVDGTHTYEVIAVDTSNNEDPTPATHNWRIDTVAPETEITEAPPAVDNSTSISIVFNSPGEPAAVFDCSLDGSPLEACTSPFVRQALTDGNHIFRVRAQDPAGNFDATPAAVNWLIDSHSPDTVIDTGPSGTVAPTTATFTFSSPGIGPGATYACHLDAAPFGPCVSPRTFVGLIDGPHTFEVRVTDALGNSDPTPARRVWTIDATGPVTSITVRPDNPSAVLTPVFQFSANEPATFECQIDGQVPYAPCVSPYTAPSLPGGPRFFRIRGTDTVGNRGAEATYEWVIDAGGPAIVITAGPNGPVASTSATFNWSSTEPATFCYRFTGDAADTCTMALAGSGTVTRAALVQGPQSFTVTGTDALGNAGPANVRNFTVDTIGPPVTITAGPSNTVGSISNSFTFTSTELATFCYRVDALGELCTSTPGLTATVTVNANDGAHTLDVVARDALANRTDVPATRAWTVDTVRPATTITAGPAQGSTLGTGDATVSLASSEAATICWRIGAGAETCSVAGAVSLDAVLAAEPDGPIVFTARSSDAIGFGPTVTRRWTIDTLRPTVVINAGPAQAATVGSSEATFTVASSEASIICWQFNATAQQCSPGGVVTFGPAAAGLPEGANTFTVFARDAIGDGPTVSRMWSIDTIRPTMTITAGPAAGSTSPNSVTTFSVASSEAATICWRFNGGVEACSAGGVLSADAMSVALPDGGTVFEVYGRDDINAGPVVSRSWTIDSLRPTITITAGPANGSTLGSTDASFTLVASEPATICWTFNGGGPVCTGPGQTDVVASATGLAQGATTFSATGADQVGAGAATARAWTIDTVRPTVTVTAGPSEGQRLNSVDATVSISSSEPSTICTRLDGAAESCSAAGAIQTDVMLASLTQGQHSLAIYARDAVGPGATLTRSFIVDTVRPSVTITAGPAEGSGLGVTTASFEVTSSESSMICWKFNGGVETCSAAGVVAAAPSANGLPQGLTTFEVYAKDATVDIFGATTTRTFTVDTVRPTVAITAGPAQSSISGEANTVFTVTSTEAATFCWRINNGVPTCSVGGLLTTDVLTGSLPEGGSTFAVEARDLVGAGTTVVRNWVIDTIRPTVTITLGPAQNERVDSSTGDFTLHSTEPSQICWTFNGGVEACSATGQIDVHVLQSGLPEGLNTIVFRAQDGVAFGATGTRQWTVDTLPPVVTISAPPLEGAQTNVTSASFDITTDEPSQICWKFDSDAEQCTAAPPPLSNLVMVDAGSKVGLTGTIHTFTVRANDQLLHQKIETRTWTVDLLPPTLTIAGLPAEGTGTIAHDFAVVLTTTEDATICYRLNADPAGFTCSPAATRNFSFALNIPGNGLQTLEMKATDLATNVYNVTRTWTSNAVPPTVSTITPADAATGIAESDNLVVTFSRAMDPATLTFKATLDADACSGSIQLSTDSFATCVPLSNKVVTPDGKTVTLTPAPGLSFGSTFKARVTAGAQAATDNTPVTAFTQANGFTTRLSPASTGVVIAQVYGSGGLASAPYQNDFVVLHNRGTSSVDISGWSLQYQADGVTGWAVNALPAAPPEPVQIIAAGGYYLVKLASDGTVGAALPAPDASPATPSNLAPGAGKLALVNGAVQLADGCPAAGAVVDLIGWGALAAPSCSETAPAPTQADSTVSSQRREIGCVDAGDNSTDFVSLPVLNNVRNKTDLLFNGLTNVCRVTHNEGGDGFELDYCAALTPSVTVVAGGNMVLAGEVYEASLTQGRPGISAKITAQAGYGPRNTNPEWQNGGWTFVAATFTGDGGTGSNNDEYSATVVAPAAGSYSYTYRFSLDGGANWTYCDLDGAGSNTVPAPLFFETPNLPLITVN